MKENTDRNAPVSAGLRSKIAARLFLSFTLMEISSLAAVPPYVFTQPASEIRPTSVILNGTAVPNGQPTLAWIEWGERGGFDRSTPLANIGQGNTVVRVAVPVTNLTDGGAYQCRLVASNSVGVSYGVPQMFTTRKRLVAWGELSSPVAKPTLTNGVSVAGGYSQTLVLKNDGTVAEWGFTDLTDVPSGLTDVIQLAAGNDFSLALKSNGTIVAWGTDTSGATNVPTDLNDAVAIAAGDFHCLALSASGSVTAWGGNSYGQTNVPIGLSNVVSIAAGGGHNLAVRADGTVIAWGRSFEGQTAVPVGLTNVIAVACGYYHSAALKADGTVTAWGENSVGQTNVPALSNLVMIAANGVHNLALDASGRVFGWGVNANSDLAIPPDLSNAVTIACGVFHSLALAPNRPPQALEGTVSGLLNHDLTIMLAGQDNDGDAVRFRITSLPARGSLYQYQAGQRGALIGSVDTWVAHPSGRIIFAPETNEVGNPYGAFTYVSNDGELDSSAANITVVIVGDTHAFTRNPSGISPVSATLEGAVLPNGLATVAWFEWGPHGGYGQTTPPIDVGAGSTVSWVRRSITGLTDGAVFQYHLVASNAAGIASATPQLFTTGKKIVCWGYGSVTNIPNGLSNVVAIAAGGIHWIALKSDGTVRDWRGSVAPNGLSNIIAVAAGSDHSLVLDSSGRLTTWGRFSVTNLPPSLTNAVAIAAGGGDTGIPVSGAVTSEGKVVIWGNSGFGQTNIPPNASVVYHN